MILTATMIYKLDQKLNKLSTSYHQQIFLEDKILALNEAQIKVIKSKVDINNAYQLGLDSFKMRYEDLQTLIVDYEVISLSTGNVILNQYIAPVASLKQHYMMHIDSYTLGTKGSCSNHPIYAREVKHSDLQLYLDNSDFAPSFEYQDAPMTISSNNLNYFTDGTYTLQQAGVSYLRYPVYIDASGYTNITGNPSTDINCEMPDYMEDEIEDAACELLAMYMENNPAVTYAQSRGKQDQ